MTRYITIFIFFFLNFAAHSSCPSTKQIITQMNVASSNIANANTSRIPQGGPYKKQLVYCSKSECVVSEDSDFKSVYDPTHIDADAKGNLLLPNISVSEEMETLIQLQELFELNISKC